MDEQVKKVMAELAKPFNKMVAGKLIPTHKWKVQNFSKAGNKGMCVPFVNRTLVANRLNEVLGLNGWQFEVKEVSDGSKIGTLSCLIGGEWISRSDVGTKSKTEAEKGSASDALKRCASLFGVGLYLNDIQSRWVDIKNRVPQDKKGNALYGDALSNFLNGMSSEQGILAELITAKPELWQRDSIRELWNEFKL